MFRFYFTWAIVLGLTAPALAQQVPASTNKPTSYRVFMRGTPIGREDVTIEKNASGLTITSQGRFAAPLNVDLKRVELKYRPDWSPEAFSLEGSTNNADVAVRTSFNGTVAVTQGTQGGKPVNVSHTISADTVVLPGGVFSAYVALSLRLAGVPPKVITAARKYLHELERRSAAAQQVKPQQELMLEFPQEEEQEDHEAVEALRGVDPDSMTPREALDALYRLKKLVVE